jgi:DNA-binding MarR family transcriptional regulator
LRPDKLLLIDKETICAISFLGNQLSRERRVKRAAEISPLDAHLGYWLRRVSNHVSHGFSLKLEALDVTVAEWVVLRELFDAPAMVPSELAAQLGMTRGAISKLADRLAAKRLAIRNSSADDRRYQTLMLTVEGRALVPVLAALADLNDAEFFGHLEPEERAMLEQTMQDIVLRHGLQIIPVD